MEGLFGMKANSLFHTARDSQFVLVEEPHRLDKGCSIRILWSLKKSKRAQGLYTRESNDVKQHTDPSNVFVAFRFEQSSSNDFLISK